jgi:hypothetical protein
MSMEVRGIDVRKVMLPTVGFRYKEAILLELLVNHSAVHVKLGLHRVLHRFYRYLADDLHSTICTIIYSTLA